MKTTIFYWCYFLCFFWVATAFSQETIINGIVLDMKKAPLQGVEITINNKLEFKTNGRGEFAFVLRKDMFPKQVSARYKGLRLQSWDYTDSQKKLEVFMTNTPFFLRGKVVSSDNQPQMNLSVGLDGIDGNYELKTDKDGSFKVELPADTDILQIDYMIGGHLMPKEHILVDRQNEKVTITYSKKLNPATQMATIAVEDELGNPIKAVKVWVNGEEYKTDQRGEFELARHKLQPDVSKPFPETTKVEVQGYEILRKEFDENDIYILIKSSSTSVTDSLYKEDINTIINELELEKQVLAQKGTLIRTEIEKVTAKLSQTSELSREQKESLLAQLQALQRTLVENEVAYEEAQAKTKEVIEKMTQVLIAKDTMFHRIEEQFKGEVTKRIALEQLAEAEQRYLIFAVLLLFVMLIGFVSTILFARSIRKQKDKISKQRDEIEEQKNEIEHTYQNIQTISNIGQEITALLDINMLVRALYKHVSALMDAGVFGVGVPNEEKGLIEFKNFLDNGQIKDYHSEPLFNEDKLSSWCFINQKSIIIKDLEVDRAAYVQKNAIKFDENTPRSIIYLPLVYESEKLGVLTVQSRNSHAYNEIDVKLLEALASYVAVALANARSYRVITDTYEILEAKNRNITDSIRYAQTIQHTILPSEKELQEAFKDNFITYLPKDIVSGDFYWLAEISDEGMDTLKTFMAVVDCTGHGVPGAFMSMVGGNLLNEIVKIRREYNPAVILQLLDHAVVDALKQQDTVNNDGMDIVLCLFETTDETHTKVTFAGTRRPLYYLQKGQKLQEIRGDRTSIGGIYRKDYKMKTFTNNAIDLELGAMLYLTTDGVADQHNIQKEKFSTQRLRNVLEENAHLDCASQKILLEQTLQQYMKGVEQRDDITIMGIRI